MHTIKKVSSLTGISAVTIRAWERRYGLGPSERTEGGHRLYSEKDVENLLWLKKITEEEGMNISQAVQLLKKKNQRDEKVKYLPITGLQDSHPSSIESLVQALKDLDANQADKAWELCLAIWSMDTVLYQVVPQILPHIGGEYGEEVTSIVPVHFASQWIMHRVSPLLRIYPIDKSLPRAITLCPSDEHHQIGLLLFTLFLRGKGMDVVYLGLNTPLEALDQYIEKLNISLVAVSISNPEFQTSVKQWIDRIIMNYPTLRVVVGGQGIKGATDTLLEWRIGDTAEEWDRWFKLTWKNN